MTTPPSNPLTLRRTAHYFWGWVGTVGPSIAALAVIFFAPLLRTITDQVGLSVTFCLVIWLSWLVGINSRIVISDDSIVVVNWFTRYNIPYASIGSTSFTPGVQIVLNDGRVIRPTIGEPSLISSLRDNIAQKRIEDKIKACRSNFPTGTRSEQATRGFTLHVDKLLLLVAPFSALTIVAFHLRS